MMRGYHVLHEKALFSKASVDVFIPFIRVVDARQEHRNHHLVGADERRTLLVVQHSTAAARSEEAEEGLGDREQRDKGERKCGPVDELARRLLYTPSCTESVLVTQSKAGKKGGGTYRRRWPTSSTR